jgi:hypothetical protein
MLKGFLERRRPTHNGLNFGVFLKTIKKGGEGFDKGSNCELLKK